MLSTFKWPNLAAMCSAVLPAYRTVRVHIEKRDRRCVGAFEQDWARREMSEDDDDERD
jgi:hypothetical protein